MPLLTPPQDRMARSASIHSTHVLARIDAHSPGSTPRLIRPWAISRTASPVCAQVHSRHRPSSFWRRNTLGPRRATPFQNSAGMVSPASTMSMQGFSEVRSHKFGTASPPGLLLLPAPLAAHAGFLHAEIELLDVV